MREVEIKIPILIKNKVLLARNTFEGSYLYQQGATITFKCTCCSDDCNFAINESSGTLLDTLVSKKIISEIEIIKNGLAKKTSKVNKHIGKLFVFPNLNALYMLLQCANCNMKFIAVFSFGESQPGRQICFLSGIWDIDEYRPVHEKN
jgi:hypothetical protein